MIFSPKDKVFDFQKINIPLRKIIKVEEAADLIAYLACDNSISYMQ